jgi:hypothetical protein
MRLVVMTGSAEGLPSEVSTEGVRLVRKPFEVSEIVAALLEPRSASSLGGESGPDTPSTPSMPNLPPVKE